VLNYNRAYGRDELLDRYFFDRTEREKIRCCKDDSITAEGAFSHAGMDIIYIT
jgi:hypothetical protein